MGVFRLRISPGGSPFFLYDLNVLTKSFGARAMCAVGVSFLYPGLYFWGLTTKCHLFYFLNYVLATQLLALRVRYLILVLKNVTAFDYWA